MSRDPELGLPPPTSPLATENSTSPEGPTSSDATVTMMFHGTTEMIPKDVRVITLAATIAFLLIVIIIMVAWIIRRKCVSTSVDRTSTNVDSVGTQVEIEAEPIGSNAAISPQGHYSGGVTTVVDQAIPQIWTNSENYLHATIPDDDHDYQQMAPPDEEDAYYENIGRTSPQNFN